MIAWKVVKQLPPRGRQAAVLQQARFLLGPVPTSRAGSPRPVQFSHAWVVGGKKTTTGSAVLVSDPRTLVRNPSLWYEFHVCGTNFNARGVGIPGSPGLLIGW